MTYETFTALAQDWLNGQIDDAGFAALQEGIREKEEFRKEFVRLTHLDSALRDFGAVETVASEMIPFSQGAETNRSGTRFWAIAATVMLVAACLWIVFEKTASDGESSFALRESDSADPIAVITGEAGAVWKKIPNVRLDEGAAIGPLTLTLQQGLAQIDFFGGASISLSAPATFELVSSESAILHHGRLKADVPPAARGFEIRTGDVVLEDLGTSFGVAVAEDQSADLFVFDGEVKATGRDGKPMLLTDGEAAQLRDGETIRKSEPVEGEFPTISKVFAHAGDREGSLYSSWKEASFELRRDPRLIAYYDFENLTVETRRLRNRASVGGGSELDGGIVGARVTDGRWAGKTALDFRREGDRVRFQIPGEFDALTIFAWVRIDALDRHLNSLFLTDYYDKNEFHWQISQLGALHFATSPMGVEDLPKNNRRFYSDSFWNRKMSGRWFLLATTVKTATGEGYPGEVIHYINGEAVGFSGGTNMSKPIPRLRIGKADLGNWSDPIWPDVAMRTLNGGIDEFGLFREALSPEEIQTLYDQGKP
jgi:hypothetical protein